MQKFEYRTPRFRVDLPVQFSVEDVDFLGRCSEISRDGMTLEIREAPAPKSAGTVLINAHDQSMEISARVAHVEANHVGLEFCYESETERDAMARLIASLAAGPRPGPVLLR